MSNVVEHLETELHNRLYDKWVGVRVQNKKRVSFEKDEDLKLAFDRAQRRRARQRERKNSLVAEIEEVPPADAENDFVMNRSMHVEQVRELPSADCKGTAPEVSWVWRLLGW